MIEDYLTAKRIGSRHAGSPGSPKTIKAYKAGLSAVERLLGKSLIDITEDDADRLMVEMESFSGAYKANILSALRGYYVWAIATGRYEGGNPFSAIAAPKATRKLPTILTREQVDCLLAAISSEKYRLFFSLMYFGGLRIGEVVQLKRDDVANDGIVIHGKGDKQRFVYLPESLRKQLKTFMRQHTDSSYIFYAESRNADKTTELTLAQAYQEFERAKQACTLRADLHPHNLRHTAATHMHAATGDLALTQKFLGHSRPETTVIYAQITDPRMHSVQRSVFGD